MMPRIARLPSIPFGWYYVALRSVTNRRILTSRAELSTVLDLLRVTLRQKGARLHAGYVAEREAHLVLQVGEGPLSAITGSFQHEYARLFNRSHDERGSLFRLHYHVLLFQQQRWLVPLVHYIHWIRRLEAPNDYTSGLWWSSDAVYRGTMKQDWVTTNVVLRMLTRGAYNRPFQEEAYRRLLEQVPDRSHAHLFKRGSPEESRLLGDTQFIKDTLERTGRRARERRRRARDLAGDIPSVVMQVVEQFNALCDERLSPLVADAWKRLVTYENVRSRSRKRPLPMVRALSVSYLVEHHIAIPAQAARFFDCGSTPVSARRRHFYVVLFREWFGAKPDILFCPRCGDERSTGRTRRRRDKDSHPSECSEPTELCDET